MYIIVWLIALISFIAMVIAVQLKPFPVILSKKLIGLKVLDS